MSKKSGGLHSMINKKFWGKKSLQPKGKALAKDKKLKNRAEILND